MSQPSSSPSQAIDPKTEAKLKKACASDLGALAKLIAHGADINLPFQSGGSLLAYACKLKNDTAALRLVQLGANPDGCDAGGQSALTIAASRNLPKLCKALVRAGADPYSEPSLAASTLACAARNGAGEAIDAILQEHINQHPIRALWLPPSQSSISSTQPKYSVHKPRPKENRTPCAGFSNTSTGPCIPTRTINPPPTAP